MPSRLPSPFHTVHFNPPPFTLPLEHVFDFNLKMNPDRVAIVHPSEGGKTLRSYSYKEFVPAIHRAGHFIREALNIQTSSELGSRVVVVLINTDTMSYSTIIAGILRAGLIPFPISPRFSPTVVSHLLQASQPLAVITNDVETREAVTKSLNENAAEFSHRPILCDAPPFSALYPGHDAYTSLPNHERKPDDTAVMLHSSSTSSIFPKLIQWSNIAISHHVEIPDLSASRVHDLVMGSFGMELFHSYGMTIFCIMVRRGLVMAVMDPKEKSSIFPVNSDDIYPCFLSIKPDVLALNARVLQSWANDEEKVAQFRESSVKILYAGQPLNKASGDKLVRNGVKVCSAYGSTETGPVVLMAEFEGMDWEYFYVNPRSDIRFAPHSDGLWEVVAVQDTVTYLPFTNTTWDGQPAYSPGDLLTLHPKKPHTYKFYGRKGDQIMLATGEFINPVPIEEEIISRACLSTAVIFGHYRPKAGIIIQPFKTSEDDPSASESVLEKVWNTIQRVNVNLPQYSRIAREMIVIACPDKPISLSPKGLPRRSVAIVEYQTEIDSLYARV